jgi:hypothetical protein
MRINATLTITAGTPINLAVALGVVASAAALATANPIMVNRHFIQMLAGGAGLGYVMDLDAFAVGTQANAATNGHLTAELYPASGQLPGGTYGDGATVLGGGLADLTKLWIDGSHTGDPVVVSVNLRI